MRQLHICLDTGMYCNLHVREYWMVYRRPGFLSAAVWFAPPPSLPPLFRLPSESSTGDTPEDWERETTCWRKRGVGGGIGQMKRPQESLLRYISVNTLMINVVNSCHAGQIGVYTKVGLKPTAANEPKVFFLKSINLKRWIGFEKSKGSEGFRKNLVNFFHCPFLG